ncbi:MAG: hypothetical protein L3J59_15665 [Methylococcaceae bacterium]|nr:hypothetical protein [Methylococcaceae bacterium]
MKPLNLLAFLFGLTLVFIPFSVHAYDLCVDATNDSYPSGVALTWQSQFDPSDYSTGTYDYKGWWVYSSYGRLYHQTATTRAYTTSYNFYSGKSCSNDYPDYDSWDSNGDPVTNEPISCTNGTKDPDEDGLDCGGVCTDACDSSACYPPAKLTFMWNDSEGNPVYNCMFQTSPDSYKNCPSGYYLNADKSICVSTDSDNNNGLPESYYSGDWDVLPDGTTIPPPSWEPTDDTTSTSYDPTETVVNNGDGTETVTRTDTTKKYNPDTDTWDTTGTKDTTVVRPENSPSGTGFTSDGSGGSAVAPGYEGSVVDTSDVPTEDNPENYDYTTPDEPEYDSDLTDLTPDEDDITGLWQTIFDASPYASIINNTTIETSGAICESVFYYNGHPVRFGFCGDLASDLFSFMSSIIVFCSGVYALFIVFGKD